MLRAFSAMLFLFGCIDNGDAPTPQWHDEDLASHDLATRPDLASGDLAMSIDMAIPPQMIDMTTPPDLTPTSDLSTGPSDLRMCTPMGSGCDNTTWCCNANGTCNNKICCETYLRYGAPCLQAQHRLCLYCGGGAENCGSCQ